MNYTDYIDELARERAKKLASTQKNTAKDTVKGAVQGFIQGGPVGAIIGAGKQIIKGAKEKGKNLRNSSQEMDKAMIKQNEAINQQAEQENEQNQQALNNIVANSNVQPTFNGYANPLPNDVVNNLSNDYGFLTGGASPVQNNNYLQENAPSLGYEGSATQEIAENKPKLGNVGSEGKEGLINKLASGLGDFASGYQENRNNGFKPENITNDKIAITKEVPNTQLQDYQQELTNTGKYTPEQVQAVANGKNSGFKEIDEWIKNNPQAYNPTTTETTYKDKGNMARLGELAGTVGRMMQKPIAQGLIAGGVSALTGNPNALATGLSYAKNRAMSNLYSDVLKQNGIDVPSNALTNISATDMSKFSDLQNAKALNNYRIDRLDADMQKNAEKLAWEKEKAEMQNKIKQQDLEIKKQNANSRATSANASMVRANNAGKKSTSSSKNTAKQTQSSGQFVVGQTPSGAKVRVPVERVKEFKSNGGKIVG